MGSKQLGSKFLKRSQKCSHTPSVLKAGAKRSEATCHMAMPQGCYLAKGAKRPSHTSNTMKLDRILFDSCNSIKRFHLCPFDQKNSTYLQPPINQVPCISSCWGKRHTPVVCNESREPHTSHYPSRPVTKIPTNKKFSYQPQSQSTG